MKDQQEVPPQYAMCLGVGVRMGGGGVLSQVVSSELETAALLREGEVALRSRG